MHSVLIVFSASDKTESPEWRDWQKLLQRLKDISPRSAAVEMLTESCWLIRASDGLSFLGSALVEAGKHGIQYRVLFLDAPPQWIHSEDYGKNP